MSALFRVDPHSPYALELHQIRRRLNPQEALFCDEYLVDLDEQRAAVAAGFLAKRGKALTKIGTITRRAIDLCMAERRERLHVTQDKVVEEYAKLGFANMGDYVERTADGEPAFVDLKELDRDRMAALSEFTIEDYMMGRGEDALPGKRVKFKLHDKKAALDSLGRHLGMFVDRTEVRHEFDARLMRMTRQERWALLNELLAPMQKLLDEGQEIEAEFSEIQPEEK